MKIKMGILPLLAAVAIVIGFMLFGSTTAFADTDEATGLEYTVTNGEATITGYDFRRTENLNIPATLGGVNVVSVGNRAFKDCMAFTSVTIPESVTVIGEFAFYGCDKMEAITLPDSVISIGDGAFDGCYRLLDVILPDNIISIGDYTFYGCGNMTNIIIPDRVTSIGNYAFYDCTSLVDISIPNSITSIGYDAFRECTSLINITIPNSVKEISGGLFMNCSSLTSITLPDNLESIGMLAFDHCTSLESITIPNNVTKINDRTFNYCIGLTRITIPNSVINIGDSAFHSCSGLKSITIPNSVVNIGDWAFENCTSLVEIAIPDSVTSIGDYIFAYCSSLKKITLPDSITSISDSAFSNCTSLTDIIIPNTVTIIFSSAFEKCTSLKDIILPDSVTGISSYTFSYCTSLSSIKIPDNVLYIEFNAFYNCTNLASIIIPNNVSSIGDNSFEQCTNLSSITIPNSVTYIGYNAFTSCSDSFTIYGYPGSYPQTYAGNNGIAFYGLATINPTAATFDKNPANRADINTTITWNDASSVMDVKKDGVSIGAEAYSVTGSALIFNTTASALTIKKEYLATQPTGSLVLTVEFDRGMPATLTINISNTSPSDPPSGGGGGDDDTPPVVPPSINPIVPGFDKNIATRVDVSTTITWNDASSVTDVKKVGTSIGANSYSINGSTLTIKKEYLATQPTGALVLTVEFDRGTPVTLTIDISDTTPVPVNSASINPTAASFDKNTANRADVSTAIIWNDASSVTDVKKAGTSIGANSYSINGNTLTIKKEYLATQPTGNLVLTVEFDRGTPVTLTIDISDTTPVPVNSASINPAAASFDKNTANRADVSTAITWNDASSVTDVKKAGVSIGANAYRISGSTLTIKKEYLATQPTGTLVLTVEFDRGTPVTLTIDISDTTPAPVNSASINPASASFDKNTANRADVSTAITWNDASSVTDVKKAGTSIGTNAYRISGSTLTIGKDFLAAQATGSLALTVEFDRGTPATLTINISDTTSEPSGPPAGGGGGGGGGLPPAAPNPPPAAADKLSPTVSIDRASGTAAASVSGDELNKAFDAAKAGSGGVKMIKIEIPETAGVNSYVLQLPSSALASTGADRQIELKSAAAGITLPGNMLQGAGFAAAGNVGISIGKADVSKLPQEVQDSIGSRPVVELKLTQGNKAVEWNNPDAPVTMSVPYVPTAEELKNPEHIVIWYIDGTGNAVSVPSGRYDAAAGAVVFTTTHFSRYAIVYAAVTFDDLGSAAWAKNQIEVLASKGIMKGASEKEFTPQAKITRADFMYSLIRALGADAEVETNFDDIDKDAYYYKEIGIAKKLGITSGTGNNRFSPDSAISRQDMMVLTDKALKLVKKLKLQGQASELEKFTDRSLIASYATGSIASIVKEGLIVGSGGGINPLGSTTRAEAAVFLYKIYYKY